MKLLDQVWTEIRKKHYSIDIAGFEQGLGFS